MTDAPERHIVVEIKLGADSIRDAVNALDHIAYWLTEIEDDIENGSGKRNMVSGGVGSGSFVDVKANPGVTNATYAAALKQYLEERKTEHAEDG